MMNNEQHKTPVSAPVDSFQGRVQPWMMACFGAEISADGAERNHRLLEESLELVQACGCTASEAHQLVEYVYGRPVGERTQEVGGVMVTLAALCLAQGLDMQAAGETELARIWTKVEAIRAKQAARPKHSPLPAAACQVVADERAAFEKHLHDIGERPLGSVAYWSDTENRLWGIWQARAALAAAPVQAQEPVAYTAGSHDIFELVREWAHLPEGSRYEAARKIIGYVNATYTAGVNDGKFLGSTSAPVQTVAVPDGWRAAIDGLMDFAPTNEGPLPGMTRGGNWLRKHDVIEALSNIAAPAAQGDAKDAELDRIKRLATCGTVDSFLLLPEQDKRYWFAMTWQESDSRKLAEERISFLHSTNKDADGYEFGIAKVKFDASGKIESFLWGLGDNSDLDAAIAAKAAS